MALLPYAADDRRDGIVGLSFAMQQIAQLLLMCDGHDIGISIDRRATAGQPRRGCSSTTTTRAASASASRCSACTTSCSTATRRLIAECECENGCPGCVGPIGNTGPLAKTAALRILDLWDLAKAWPRSDGAIDVSLPDRLRGVVRRRPPANASLRPSNARAVQTDPLRPLGGEWRGGGGRLRRRAPRSTPPR